MSEYIVKVNETPTITRDGWSVRCDDLFIKREEIVRCRDCAYYATDELGDYCTLMDFEDTKSMADMFCAWGELREDKE